MATDGRTEAGGRMIAIASYTELMDADLIAALACLANVDAPYPEALLAKRRAWFLAMLDNPDAVDCDTEPVSEWQDERNSRPLPY
jgi:hypothetical protein